MASEYGSIFGEETALGLGLGRSPRPKRESVEDYREDPAEAFSRAASNMQPPGGAIPVPFVETMRTKTVPKKQNKPSGACRPALPE